MRSLTKVNIFAIWLVALTVLSAVLPVSAEVLRGGVQEEDLRIRSAGRPMQGQTDKALRINRAPQALAGSAVDSTAFAAPMTARSGPMSAGVVDTNEFAKGPKNFDIGAERQSKEMVLAWERWHKQLSEAIYTRWQSLARDPGRATIRVTVSKNRRITAQIMRSDGGPRFDATVMEAIASIDGNPGLNFPAKSLRNQVSFEADYIAASDVTPGYSWVKNDYERVREDR